MESSYDKSLTYILLMADSSIWMLNFTIKNLVKNRKQHSSWHTLNTPFIKADGIISLEKIFLLICERKE